MSVVLLVRHGQASFGVGSYDRLSDDGRAQAQRLADQLAQRGLRVERIVSGALQRQRETAELLSPAFGGLPVTVDARWNEYEHEPLIAQVKPAYRHRWLMVADLARSGDPGRSFQALLDQSLARWVGEDPAALPDDAEVRTLPGGMEPFRDYRARIGEALDDITAQSGISVVVSSAGTIAAAAAPLLGVPATGWPALQRVMVNTSVTKVVRGQRGITLVSFNEHGHLEGVPGLKVTYR